MTNQKTNQPSQNWQESNLSKVCEISAGNPAPQDKKYFINGSYPFIRVRHLTNDNKYVLEHDRINDLCLKDKKLKLFPKDAIIFAKSGMSLYLNKKNLLPQESYIVSHLAILNPDREKIEPLFLYYWALLFRFSDLSRATNLPSMRLGDIENVKIQFPPSLKTQQAIVQAIETHFSRLDNAIKNLKSVKNKIQLYRKSVLKKAFEKKGDWEEKKIGDVSKKIQYGLTSKSGPDKRGLRYLRITDIQKGKVNWEQVPYSEETNNLDKYELNEGDIVFARTGATVGKSFLIKGIPERSVFASYLIRVVSNKEQILPEFLYYYFQSPMYWEKIGTSQVGIGQPNVNGQILSNMKIPLPKNLQTQQQIVQDIESKFSVIDKVEEAVDKSLKKTERLRKSILKSAFEGRLVEE